MMFWTQTALLTSDTPGANQAFGVSTAIYDNTVIISEPGRDNGVVHIYEKVDGVWTATQLLTSSDCETSNGFGVSVSIYENQLAIGDSGNNHDGEENIGAVYIFETVGDLWVETDKLISSDYASHDSFGESISMVGDQLIVGAPAKSDLATHASSAYIFEWIDDSYWSETAILVPADPLPFTKFGHSVGISENDAIIGAFFEDSPTDPEDSVGTAYIFSFTGDGWEETKHLRPLDPDAGDEFGYSVSISGGTAIVGSFRNDDDGKNSGSAYIFGTIPITNAINENDATSILIYPNPITNNVLHIKTDLIITSISITDVSGRLIMSGIDVQDNQVNLPERAKGCYFVQVTTNNEELFNQQVLVR